jgi:hypothetical protein
LFSFDGVPDSSIAVRRSCSNIDILGIRKRYNRRIYEPGSRKTRADQILRFRRSARSYVRIPDNLIQVKKE